jgi:hypothetical protein
VVASCHRVLTSANSSWAPGKQAQASCACADMVWPLCIAWRLGQALHSAALIVVAVGVDRVVMGVLHVCMFVAAAWLCWWSQCHSLSGELV